MSEPYSGWVRFRYPEGYSPPGELLQFGRLKLGELMASGRMLNLQQMRREFHLPDGSFVQVQFDGTTPIITITPSTLGGKKTDQTTVLWIPRGFIVYPAWSDARGGVGLPVIQDGDNPYTAENLAPGDVRDRWTVGGVCGEVLISRDKDAGYPTDPIRVTTPLLFHPTKGPGLLWKGDGMYDTQAPEGNWTTYRIEFELPQLHFPNDNPADALALYEQLNQVRTSAGVTPFYLTPRGLAKKAEIAASILLTAGSTVDYSASYPPTYQHSYDRLTKEGVTANMQNVAYTSWNRGDGLPMFELRSNAGGATAALAEWMADPDLSAVIQVDMGAGAFANTGSRGGYLCATVEEYTGWLGAGNIAFYPGDKQLPILTWYGFASMNQAFETFPCIFDTPHWDTAPLVPFMNFTNANGDCWLNYTRSATPTVSDVEPAMSRHIFSRGRRLAIAPNGGLVWGACWQTFNDNDRLIAVIHHPEDQPGSLLDGMTRYVRVWWCDVPKRANLRGDPQAIIAGTDPDDAWGWKGGTLVDIGVMPAPSRGAAATGAVNSLKYTAGWRFSPDGSKAACLRDYAGVQDYGHAYIPPGSGGPLYQSLSFINPRTVELFFTASPTALDVTHTFHDYVAGQNNAPINLNQRGIPLTGDSIPETFTTLYDRGLTPVAVDYDEDGNLLYAYVNRLVTMQPAIFTYKDVGYAAPFEFIYYGVGNGAITRSDQLSYRTYGYNGFKYLSSQYATLNLAVADVRSGSFATMTQAPWFDYAQPAASDPPCLYFTSAPVLGVQQFQRGVASPVQWMANPDGYIPHVFDDCRPPGATDSILVLEDPPSAALQVYYARRFDDEVFSAQFAPTPMASRWLSAAPSDADCGCGITVDEFAALAGFMAYADWAPRGGAVVSSVPLPDHDWLIYTKVV